MCGEPRWDEGLPSHYGPVRSPSGKVHWRATNYGATTPPGWRWEGWSTQAAETACSVTVWGPWVRPDGTRSGKHWVEEPDGTEITCKHCLAAVSRSVKAPNPPIIRWGLDDVDVDFDSGLGVSAAELESGDGPYVDFLGQLVAEGVVDR